MRLTINVLTMKMIFLQIGLVVLAVLVLIGILRTWQINSGTSSRVFSRGGLPSSPLDRFYSGNAVGLNTSWAGKKFNATQATGINIIKNGKGSEVEKYPFKTYTGNGLVNKDLQVLKIDYNIPENPFWLRWILDEVVEIAPGQYLGKMHVRLIPGFPFSVLYFELKK